MVGVRERVISNDLGGSEMSVHIGCSHCGQTFPMDPEMAATVLGEKVASSSEGTVVDVAVISLHDLVVAAIETAREAQDIARKLAAENQRLAEELCSREEATSNAPSSGCHGPL